MKKTLLSIFIALFSANLMLAQQSAPLFSKQDTIIGKNLLTGADVIAKQYIMPEKIYRWHYRGNDNLLLELRATDKKGKSFKKDGSLTMIDLSDKNSKWSRKVNYNHCEIQNMGDNLFLNIKNKAYCLDELTGENKWESNIFFYFIDSKANIGVGYPLQSMSNSLSAIDLHTGKELWKTKLERTYGWDDVYLYNDSTLLIGMNGLNAYDLRSGHKWNYIASTHRKEIGQMIGVNVVGLILTAITGSGFFQTEPNVATDMVSNIYIDKKGDLVLASRQKISRLNDKGDVIWSTSLPEKITSKSSLFGIDSTIYMVNRGYAQYNGGFSMIGDPYIAAFDCATGNKLYMNIIPEKEKFIRNFQVINDMLFIVFENKMATYSLKDGQLLSERLIDLNKNEELEAFVESGVYIKSADLTFVDLMAINPQMNYVLTNQNRVIALNDSLEPFMDYDKEMVFTQKIDWMDYQIVEDCDGNAFIINNDNRAVMKIDNRFGMFRENENLYMIDNQFIREINLNQLR